MALKTGDIIKVSYTGKLEDGRIFDTTDKKIAEEMGIADDKPYGPLTVVVGSGLLVQGLEEDLIGKEKGYKGSVKVPPEKGFGLRSIDLIETYPAKKFEIKLIPGQHVEFDDRLGVVESVSGGRVKIDFNDPLAGKTIIYDYKIEDLITDNDAKVAEIVKQYVTPSVKYTYEDETVTINVPKEFYLEDSWLVGKFIISRFLIKFVGVKKVVFIETIEEEDFKQDA
jgi:FKBP-type peptidyl-prolyl cis-trans isomerase 2